MMPDYLTKYWTGKKVLITGASSGLGRAITGQLAPFGVHFCLLSRRIEPMQELAGRLQKMGSSFWIRSCDVRSREETEKAIYDFHRAKNGLDVVWANSGVGGRTSFNKWNWENYDNVLDTNLTGAVQTIIPALQIMTRQGYGTIVGIGSAASMRGLPNHPVYGITKMGLHYFLESLAIELPQIQFTIIHPGFVDTPISESRSKRIWLMQPGEAAQIMIKAVAKRKKIMIYPRKMKYLYYLVRFLPTSLYRFLAKNAVHSEKV